MSERRLTEREWQDIQDLRKFWNTFCDADIGVPENFIERMEEAGFAELRTVTKKDLAQISFAAERGIELGGQMWVLTAKGHSEIDAKQPVT